MPATGLHSSHENRLLSLKNRHADLELKIREEEKRPLPSDYVLKKLKKDKLEIKELIERAEHSTHH